MPLHARRRLDWSTGSQSDLAMDPNHGKRSKFVQDLCHCSKDYERSRRRNTTKELNLDLRRISKDKRYKRGKFCRFIKCYHRRDHMAACPQAPKLSPFSSSSAKIAFRIKIIVFENLAIQPASVSWAAWSLFWSYICLRDSRASVLRPQDSLRAFCFGVENVPGFWRWVPLAVDDRSDRGVSILREESEKKKVFDFFFGKKKKMRTSFCIFLDKTNRYTNEMRLFEQTCSKKKIFAFYFSLNFLLVGWGLL